QVGPVSGHEAAGPRYRLEVIGAAGGVARDQAVGVELGHHHARDALVDLAVVGRRRAAWIGRVVDAAVAVVVDAVAALRTVGAGRPRDPAVIALVVVLVARATGIVREVDLPIGRVVVVDPVRAVGDRAAHALARHALHAHVAGLAGEGAIGGGRGPPPPDGAPPRQRGGSGLGGRGRVGGNGKSPPIRGGCRG